ncbi:hypothetical protein ACSVBT_18425 [Afipia sp. TerB]
MIVTRLMSSRFALPLAVSAALWGVMSGAQAQVPFPAPLPGQSGPPAFPAPLPGGQSAPAAAPANASPALAPMKPLDNAPAAFPSQGAAPGGFSPAPGPQAGPPPGAAKCQQEFMPLRQDVEKRMASIQGLGKRKAPASEACAALRGLSTAETKMIKYVEVNAQKCGIPEQAHKQLNDNHAHTTKLTTQVCNVAAQQAQAQQRGPAGPSLSDVLGSTALPEARPAKRGGGSTFDTLSGNVLAR